MPPDHEVCICTDTSVVIDTADGDNALLLQISKEVLRLFNNLAAVLPESTRDCAEYRELEVTLYSVEGIEIKLGHGHPFSIDQSKVLHHRTTL